MRAQVRSALRSYAEKSGHPSPRSIGASIRIGRTVPKEKESITSSAREKLRLLILASMHGWTQKYAAMALVAYGVGAGSIATLRLSQIAVRGDGADRHYLVPATRGSRKTVVEIRGPGAKVVAIQIGDARASGRDLLFCTKDGSPYTRPGIQKMVHSTGAFKIEGITPRNLFGALREESMSEEKKQQGFTSLEDVNKHVGNSMHKPVYDPSTGKMRVLVGGGASIETEIHESFVEELRKQGIDAKASSALPSSKLEEAVKQVVSERLVGALKIATGMVALADGSPDTAERVLAGAVTDAFKRTASDPGNALVDLVDATLASIVVSRALVLAGKKIPE